MFAESRLYDRAVWLAGLALLCVALFVVLYAVAVRTAWGQEAGNAALAGRSNRPPAVIGESLDLLSTISLLSLAVAGGVIVAIGLGRGGIRLAFAAGIVVLGANVTTQLLKSVVLNRPSLMGQSDPFGQHNSLPSGHATVAMSLVVALALVLPATGRPLGLLIGAVYALAVGAATVTAGWHRPSDVMAAQLVAVCWAAIAGAALLVLRPLFSGGAIWNEQLATSRLPVWLTSSTLAAAVLIVAVVGLLAAVAGSSWDELTAADTSAAYFAGIAATIASGIFLLSLLMAALTGVDLGAIDDP